MSFADEAAAAVQTAYRGLTPAERQVAGDTRWLVMPAPTAADWQAVGATPDQGVMLGIFKQPGGFGTPTVTLFEQPIRQQQMPVWAVVEHEMTHVLGYDHALREHAVAHACGVTRGQVMPGRNDNCPPCQVYNEVAVGSGLLEDLAEAINFVDGIPPGLGGTIPQARLHFLKARELLDQAAVMLSDRAGEVASLRACLQHTLMALADHLSPNDIAPAALSARQCRRDAHRLAWAFYARQRSGVG